MLMNFLLRLLKWRLQNANRKLAVQTALQAKQKDDLAQLTLTAIGGMIVLWAKLEAKLDHINELAFLNGGKGVVDREIPRNLEQKLVFMRRAHARLPWLQDLKGEGGKVIAAFKELRDERHQLVHGAIEGLFSDEDPKFIRHIHGAGPLESDAQQFSTERFLAIGTKLVALSHRVHLHHESMDRALLASSKCAQSTD